MASDGEISCANDPNFAVIYSFLKVFSKLYGLEVPSLAKLQEYIENTQEVSESLKELHLRLLRRALKSVLSSRWEKGLIKFCHQQGHHQEAWEIERFSYKKASTQVKLEVLKLLLEYQFTCHPKFKTAVNAISCKELRLNPIGRDKNGCVYWLEVDNDANLCLYKEDQDEETWQLVARNRDELVKVITLLKTGEEVCPLNTSNVNEDSSSAEITPKESGKSEVDEDNEEEFLSPESESEHESESKKEEVPLQEDTKEIETTNHDKQEEPEECSTDLGETTTNDLDNKQDSPKQDEATEKVEESKVINEEVGEAIEEPVMIVTGEGSGADCDSSYIGEEIIEEVMYFYEDGYGYDNDTGNPEVIEQTNSPEHHSDDENTNEEFVNGECELNSSNKTIKLGKDVKLKSSLQSINKRSLKKQSNDTTEVLKPESKKHCIRDLDKSDSSLAKNSENELKREASVNDKSTTDSESTGKSYIKKGRRSKVKKKIGITNQMKIKDSKEIITSISETDNGHDCKTNIIEKRKSSVSSEDHDETSRSDNDKDKSPDKELKVEDPLPPKKLRLEITPESDVNVTHSKAKVKDSVGNDKEEDILNYPITQRKKIKASKGKFKRKNIADNSVNKSNKDNNIKDSNRKVCKSLKRSLLDATVSDKNKTESQSDSEEDEPVTSGKRLKFKPKKFVKSSRKKVEAKLRQTHSSDESDDETLYSLAGKKTFKKLLKKKPKNKEKHRTAKEKKSNTVPVDDNSTPVRTSRRIALMKIKEQSQGKHADENIPPDDANKKEMKEEEEWRESGASSSEGERGTAVAAGRQRAWRGSASSGPEPDSESDEPLFELVHEEPELNFDKSDHEFSPESDLESGEPAEPLKLARTLQEEQDEGFCKRCGSGEQPEWILLCDRCDAGYHASCLKPMLFLVPEGDWFCPQCNHDRLIESLESELTKYDELLAIVEAERVRRKEENPILENDEEKDHKSEKDKEKSESDESGSSGWSSSSSSSDGAVYRLRARKQLPVSYRAREYDRLISTAIKEEFVEATTSAGNQGRGKDISTIIEAAEEEKMKAEREAIEQGKPVESKKLKRKQRRKPRKLNSLDVPSEDDDETDEDFKDTGMESSSEEISSSAERESTNDSRSSDSLPIRRMCRSDKKERPKLKESSPEVKKKKKGVFDDSSSESVGGKEWAAEKKLKKSKSSHKKRSKREKSRKRRRGGGALTQYDAEGNVIRARVTYGGLSDEDANDWSPKHRTRQKKINYTEMPNTESEDEMHKSSGKHMPDSSDEFKVSDSEMSSGSDGGRAGGALDRSAAAEGGGESDVAERRRMLTELIKTAVVPIEKLPDDVTRAKTEELHAHLNAQAAMNARPLRGRGSRGGRGTRGGRGRRGRGLGVCGAGPVGGDAAASDDPTDDALAKLVGVKIKDLSHDSTPIKHNQAEREKKRLEREAKQAEKEARRIERIQKKEEKEKLKEQRAKEREEKRLAKLALQESKRMKKEKPEPQLGMGYGMQVRPVRPAGPDMQRMNMYGNAPIPIRHPTDFQDQRFPATPRLQVRAELRRADAPPDALRDGTLSVAGSPQPFKPVSEEPSIITRMPHMINHQYRGPVMYGGNNTPYGPPRAPQNVMYSHHFGARGQYPPRGYCPPPPYPPRPQLVPTSSPGPAPRVPTSSPLPLYRTQPPAGPLRPPMGQFGPHGPGTISGSPARPPSGPPPGPVSSPATLPPRSTPPDAPLLDLPVRIKAEVKTEPEYRSPVSSPAPPSPGLAPHDPPRHPKIKHTENKDRRPRHPLGPYAPHYGPYGPYAPGPGPPPDRLAAPASDHPRPQFGPPPYHLQRPPYSQFPAPAGQDLRAVDRARSPEPRPPGAVPALLPEPRAHPPESYIPAHMRPPGPIPERLPEPRAPPPESYMPAHLRPAGPPVERAPDPRPPPPESYMPAHLRPVGPPVERAPEPRPPPPESYMPAHLRPAGPPVERAPEPRPPPPESYLPAHLRPPPRQPAPYAFPSRGFTAHAVQRLLANPSGEPAPAPGPAPAPPPTGSDTGEEGVGRGDGGGGGGGGPRDDGGVFGGLVSYFSSQHEDDMDT